MSSIGISLVLPQGDSDTENIKPRDNRPGRGAGRCGIKLACSAPVIKLPLCLNLNLDRNMKVTDWKWITNQCSKQ